MRKMSIPVPFVFVFLSGCATVSSGAGKPPPFECTSPYPEICELQEQFHNLRFEQSKQNAAIEEAERRRKAAIALAASTPAVDEPRRITAPR